ncbi:MAG TPA: saccharopine dehydrogenase NADP-binding domain-containing protein [Propionibacteriaceae bacterium]|nr:saccharopine dehydrogenase NADP-binding domain-containing protein [Propionibacteriaceae bacterium]
MTVPGSRELDLVLVGATGFVGRLTARQLALQAPAGLRVALAGRSPERLGAVRETLGPAAADWPLLTVDVSGATAVAALAARARVVVSTVGPYLRYGLPLVQACAEAGTDYADLTGETLFVRRSIDACHARARETGARIVHACGFDSVPSDLAVGLTAARATADGHLVLGRTAMHVRSLRAGISGGTVDSLRQQLLELETRPEERSVAADPTCLTDGAAGRPAKIGRLVARDRRTGVWHAPFVMGLFNAQIVYRSASLTGGAYGAHHADFVYSEVLDTGTGMAGAVAAAAMAGAPAALMASMRFGPSRRLLDAVLPKPGHGPSERVRRRGRFRIEVEADTFAGPRYRTAFGAELDPGYDATAVMLAESGLALATDDLPDRGGVLTPWTALGETLAQRLRARDFTIATEAVAD